MAEKERKIQGEIIVAADLQDVWEAWTTEAGAKTFFAPDCAIDLRPGGAYEMYFDPESPPGFRGGEGCRILAVQPKTMLSFTWNAPPGLSEVRGQYTHVIVRFSQEEPGTRVILTHDGWGSDGEWDKAFDYFTAAWLRVVLPGLKYRFAQGPIDWENPPNLKDI
jgi:uncharacterized protein YndB with AHSA1/START domain